MNRTSVKYKTPMLLLAKGVDLKFHSLIKFGIENPYQSGADFTSTPAALNNIGHIRKGLFAGRRLLQP
ncbi:MAG TPA: hypothetical protein DCR40_05480 [Prolixibacteraceae bacterium]|nr:hypothetical protein [Prolixibacteraceae bacterium]